MSDPDLGWSMGKTLIGDHDVLHPLPQPTESLTHALAWNACQVLSLDSTFQLREERSRNSESKLHEEIPMLREELLKTQKESDENSKSCETLRVELEEKSKIYDVLRQELQQVDEKYSVELTTGEKFLNSALGKTLLTSTGEKAVEGYRASSAFRHETKLVSEEIVRMIEPSVPEPGDENNEELIVTLDEILGDIDDDEMIEALRQNPI
ncbi:B-cell receptor-associated protein 31-like [Dorcoceras hygrometricum]|uniref:B-cell receptor-associated protein 31-like n=1 Tax=Dorcoceras hygrometricum TaxID=472368 RepID=A0A2Z7AHP7_9LAMI|nr:B-cell receptor-associated protein 31-like [Dorcoceras hygrometricum]